eukprot:gene1504-3344_t
MIRLVSFNVTTIKRWLDAVPGDLRSACDVLLLQETRHAKGDRFCWWTRRWGGQVVASEGSTAVDETTVSETSLAFATMGRLTVLAQGPRFQSLRYVLAGRKLYVGNLYSLTNGPRTAAEYARAERARPRDLQHTLAALQGLNGMARLADKERAPCVVGGDFNYHLAGLAAGEEDEAVPLLIARLCEGTSLALCRYAGDAATLSTSTTLTQKGARLLDGFFANKWARPGVGPVHVGRGHSEPAGHCPVA